LSAEFGAGGRLDCDLHSRSRAHMRRGHVPPVEASEAHAIVNSAGKKDGPLCEYACSKSRPVFVSIFWSCFMPGRPAIGALAVDRREFGGWDGVGTAAVTLVGSIAYFTGPC
jgi:hypothetical protein